MFASTSPRTFSILTAYWQTRKGEISTYEPNRMKKVELEDLHYIVKVTKYSLYLHLGTCHTML